MTDYIAKLYQMEGEATNDLINLFKKYNVKEVSLPTDADDPLVLLFLNSRDGADNITIEKVSLSDNGRLLLTSDVGYEYLTNDFAVGSIFYVLSAVEAELSKMEIKKSFKLTVMPTLSVPVEVSARNIEEAKDYALSLFKKEIENGNYSILDNIDITLD